MTSLAIGIVFDLLGSYPRKPGDPADVDVEYEPEETVEVLEAAIRAIGHRPLRIGNPETLLGQIGKGELPALNAVLNIAEGRGGRNREAWAPILLEMAQIPTLGSDALTLSITLDKAWASERVAGVGIGVPSRIVLDSAAGLKNIELPGPFPLFVKPRWEGTAKGISRTSKVADAVALAREVARVNADYDQPALVEEFLPGAEYTVTVIGNDPPCALPIVQRALDVETGIGVHAIESDVAPSADSSHTPGELTPEIESEIAQLGLAAYRALDCLDFARVDFKLDVQDRPRFLEINPLPSFAPDGSFGVLAELAGRPLEALLADVIQSGLDRLGLA